MGRVGSVIEKKKLWAIEQVKANPSLGTLGVMRLVKGQFGTGISGKDVRAVMLIAKPGYIGKPHHSTKCTGALQIKSTDKVKICKLYKSAGKFGILPNVLRAAILDAVGLPTASFDFDKKLLDRMKQQLTQYRRVCLSLTKQNTVVLVNPKRYTITDKRGK